VNLFQSAKSSNKILRLALDHRFEGTNTLPEIRLFDECRSSCENCPAWQKGQIEKQNAKIPCHSSSFDFVSSKARDNAKQQTLDLTPSAGESQSIDSSLGVLGRIWEEKDERGSIRGIQPTDDSRSGNDSGVSSMEKRSKNIDLYFISTEDWMADVDDNPLTSQLISAKTDTFKDNRTENPATSANDSLLKNNGIPACSVNNTSGSIALTPCYQNINLSKRL